MLTFRKATIADTKLYFDWANDPSVREQSYNSNTIDFENHKKWFESKINDSSCLMIVFQNEKELNIGQIRLQKENEKEALIGISIASDYRGMGYAKDMLQLASDFFLDSNPNFLINAYIKEDNLSSKFSFEKAGFKLKNIINYENFQSFHYVKRVKE